MALTIKQSRKQGLGRLTLNYKPADGKELKQSTISIWCSRKEIADRLKFQPINGGKLHQIQFNGKVISMMEVSEWQK